VKLKNYPVSYFDALQLCCGRLWHGCRPSVRHPLSSQSVTDVLWLKGKS